MFSPKIEIINYFDELIHQVDIDIEDSIKKYKNNFLGNLECFKIEKRTKKADNKYLEMIGLFESQQKDENQLWSESTKAVDYLNQVRMRTIEELKKAQDETFEYYTLNSSQFNYLKEMKDEEKLERLKSQLFAEKFYFQLRLTSEGWIFKLFTFLTDFYMSPSDINLLEMFINKNKFEQYSFINSTKPVFDEKVVLVGLLWRYFFVNLSTLKFPNHVISVFKRDIVNIKNIISYYLASEVKLNCSSIDLSKLERLNLLVIGEPEEIELDGLLSLQNLNLTVDSVKRFSAKNLPSLKHFTLESKKLNKSISSQIFQNLSNIKSLEIKSIHFCDINLNELINLERLSIYGWIENNFNFDLFKNVCNHLKELSISLKQIVNQDISKLLYGHNFPYLVALKIQNSKITKLEKKLFDGFPKLQSLSITNNEELLQIDNDAFSSWTNLVYLDLQHNCFEAINQLQFSGLINLETLNLSKNQIESIEENAFSSLKNLKDLDLSDNKLSILNPKSLIGLENLKILTLTNNNLTYFDPKSFDYIGNIKRIYIFGDSIIETRKDSSEIFFKF